MASDRIQRQIDRLLDEVEEAIGQRDWAAVRDTAEAVLRLDPSNATALAYLAAAERDQGSQQPQAVEPPPASRPAPALPTSFASGRYEVKRFLGEGGKKKVYLAHDTLLDRDVAFALIKTEGLDDAGRQRIQREAQAMGRLGAHPHIVTVFDLGQEGDQPFMVTKLMGGGDVESLIEKAEDHRVPLEQALRIADEVCRGLAFAHERGIVHRDLKPGNVWLTADPSTGSGQAVAKIGDFGLAVAIDRSRLTQAGMMVGTVSYMPPSRRWGARSRPAPTSTPSSPCSTSSCAGDPPSWAMTPSPSSAST